MVNYAEAIEREFEECARRTGILRAELVEIDRSAAERLHALGERATEQLRQAIEENAEEIAREQAEAEERERREAEERAERERLETEAREHREAIARAAAARRAADVVTPIDEDDDPEGEYYRRQSWLI